MRALLTVLAGLFVVSGVAFASVFSAFLLNTQQTAEQGLTATYTIIFENTGSDVIAPNNNFISVSGIPVDWLAWSSKIKILPGESTEIKAVINVPSDARPDVYHFKFIVSTDMQDQELGAELTVTPASKTTQSTSDKLKSLEQEYNSITGRVIRAGESGADTALVSNILGKAGTLIEKAKAAFTIDHWLEAYQITEQIEPVLNVAENELEQKVLEADQKRNQTALSVGVAVSLIVVLAGLVYSVLPRRHGYHGGQYKTGGETPLRKLHRKIKERIGKKY
ncbi:MAG: hypothetical protein HY362_01785 [Candidatus Aenigmarchaeota archaeon]|nr:hypothetical protein [Candidatus Aenigmarchaeota archaeon]